MIEAVQALAAWLADATWGVNALLANPGFLLGSDPAPASVTIVNEIDDPWVSRREITADLLTDAPYLAVYQSGPATFDPHVQRMTNNVGEAPGSAVLALVYIGKNSASDIAARDTKHIMRAARGALWLLQDPANGAARNRNGARLETLTALELQALHEERGDAVLTAALLATYTTRESAPFLS